MLAGGLLSGAVTGEPAGGGIRLTPPRLQGKNVEHNVAVAASLKEMAGEKGCTPAQIAVAWLLTRGGDVVPLVGMSCRSRLTENLGVLNIRFSGDELAALDRHFASGAIQGDRYPAFVMKYAAQ